MKQPLNVLALAAVLWLISSADLSPLETHSVISAAEPTAAKEQATAPRLAPPGPTSWPSFRNGNQQLGVAGSELPDKLELLWQLPTPDGVAATAAIVGEFVYVGTLSGDLLSLDRRTGRKHWSYRTIDDPDPNTFAPGFKAAPLVTADAVYIGDEEGTLHAVDRATGKKHWTFVTDGEIAGCPSIVDDRLIIGSHDSFLYCLKTADGSVVWKFQTQDRVNCSPAIAEKYTFVAGCDEHLRVINIETGEQKSDIPLESYLIASPAVLGDMLYVGNYASEVVAVDWKKEEIVWKYRDAKREFPYHASAAVTDKYVVVGGQDKQLHCIDRKTGQGVWVFPTRGQINSSPVIVGDRVFVGSNDGNVYGVGLKDGKELWKYGAGRSVTASPAVGEGCLVIGAEATNGAIYCFGTK